VNSVMVSVCMITYNHEKFISQAIEGVLAQKTKFPFELVIGEDCSTDTTSGICRKYATDYPDIISLSAESVNLGAFRNGTKSLDACTGKYIALCEGDDYWTDPYKLQKQIDLLESHPESSFCFTKVDMLCEQSSISHSYQTMDNYPSSFSLSEYLDSYYPIPMLTKVFRRSILREYGSKDWEWTKQVRYLDNVMHMCDLMNGRALFLNEVTGVYRVHDQSVTRLAPQDDRWHIEEILLTHYHFINFCPEEFVDRYKSIRAFHFEKLLDNSLARKLFFQFLKDLLRYFTDGRSGSIIRKVTSMKKLFLKHLATPQ
jgi:glycosyltransferase involved in cell wall biosynthesis